MKRKKREISPQVTSPDDLIDLYGVDNDEIVVIDPDEPVEVIPAPIPEAVEESKREDTILPFDLVENARSMALFEKYGKTDLTDQDIFEQALKSKLHL